MIFAGVVLSEPVASFLLPRDAAFSFRGQTVLMVLQVFCLGVGAGLLFLDRTVRFFGTTLEIKKATYLFIALCLPFFALVLAEILLALLVNRVDALSSVSRVHDFSAFEDYKTVKPVQGENSPWRQLGFRLVGGLPLYHQVNKAGTRINSDGLRTREFTSTDPAALKVAVLGGSTVWGSNVTDDHTVPAFLEALLNEKGAGRIEVYNLGVEGYGFENELRLLKFSGGKVNFDIAVFYHAGNDFIKTARFIAGKKTGVGGAPILTRSIYQFELFRLMEGLSLRFANSLGLVDDPDYQDADSQKLIAQRAEWYRTKHAEAVGLCRQMKIRCLFILQPTIYNRTSHYDWELALYRNLRLFFPGGKRAYNLVVDGIVKLRLDQVYDVRDVFDDVSRPLFGDLIHVNTEGNRIIAERIKSVLSPSVRLISR